MATKFDDQVHTAADIAIWDDARNELGLGDDNAEHDRPDRSHSINIGDLATTRHVRRGNGAHVAMRWFDRHDIDAAHPVDISYDMLDHRTNRFAGALHAHGIDAGAGVATLAGRVPEMYVAALGTLKANCVYTPLFSALGPEPVAQRLSIGKVQVLVTTPVLFRRTVVKILDRLPDLRLVLVVGATEESIVGVPARGSASRATVMSFGFFIGEGHDTFEGVETAPDTPASLHFTSGTTGVPKGIVQAHDAVVGQYATARAVLDLGPDDIYWCTADPGWVTGTAYGIVAPLVCGATMIVDEADFDARRCHCILSGQHVDVFYTAPAAIRKLQGIGAERAPTEFSELRLVASVGEPLDAESARWAQRVFGVPVLDTCVHTETGAITIANRHG